VSDAEGYFEHCGYRRVVQFSMTSALVKCSALMRAVMGHSWSAMSRSVFESSGATVSGACAYPLRHLGAEQGVADE
jgi:hypothetical protein